MILSRRNLIIGAVIAIAVVVGSAVALKISNIAQPQRVRIAVNIPLSGPIATFTGQYPSGLSFGIADGCRDLGVSCDTFETDIQDNAGKPAQAVSVLEKQRLQGFNAYISGTSDMSNAIAIQLDVMPVPHFLIAFDAFLTSQGNNRLRILPNYKIEGPVYVEYARVRSARKVIAITLNNSAIQEEFSRLVEPGLRQQGIEFRREVFDWGFSDFNTLAAKVKTFQPDLIFISGFAVHILPTVQALRAQGLVGNGNILCTMDFLDLLNNNTPRAELAGVASIAPPFEIPGKIADRDAWIARFQERFKQTPNYVPAYAYDTGRLLLQAYKKQSKVSRDAILAQMPYSGVTGTITVDADGDLNTPLGIVKVSADGNIVTVQSTARLR